MPLYHRQVHPVMVGRLYNPADVEHKVMDSLEDGNNRTLANVIRQLASLGHHAQTIFEGLKTEGDFLYNRMVTLSKRVEGLSENVEKIIKEDEEREDDDTLDESKQITDLTEWRSTYQSDAGFFTQATRPATIQELYNNCEKVPELEKLQPYREDEKLCPKLYSDPGMFFNIWKENMLNEAKTFKMKRKNTKKRKLVKKRENKQRGKLKTRRDVLREQEEQRGNVFTPHKSQEERSKVDSKVVSFQEFPPPPEEWGSFEAPLTPLADYDIESPPPPSPEWDQEPLPPDIHRPNFAPPLPPSQPDPEPVTPISIPSDILPPPPPPPPPLGAPVPPPPPPPPPTALGGSISTKIDPASVVLKPTPTVVQSTRAPVDPRSALLKQIEEGKKLRKVSSTVEKRNTDGRGAHKFDNVTDILHHVIKERFAATQGDSESETDDGSDMFEDNDSEWSDDEN